MEHEFPESDWKTFSELREVALERFCKRVLDEAQRFPLDMKRSYHQRYIELFRWLGERNDELAKAFDDPRRSQSSGSLLQSTRTAFSKKTSSPDSRRKHGNVSSSSPRRHDDDSAAQQWIEAEAHFAWSLAA